MDQVEGMSKPCLTLSSQLRDGSDAILSMDGAIGNIVAGADQGFFVLQNIGTGVAMNVKYHFTRDTDNLQHPSRWRYVPYVVPEGRTTLVEGVTAYNLTHKVTIEYESYGGRKYRTTIQLVRRVITEFTYLEIKSL